MTPKMKLDKAIKVALECMEIVRKQKHRDNLAGFAPNATERENEILEAMAFLIKGSSDVSDHHKFQQIKMLFDELGIFAPTSEDVPK